LWLGGGRTVLHLWQTSIVYLIIQSYNCLLGPMLIKPFARKNHQTCLWGLALQWQFLGLISFDWMAISSSFVTNINCLFNHPILQLPSWSDVNQAFCKKKSSNMLVGSSSAVTVSWPYQFWLNGHKASSLILSLKASAMKGLWFIQPPFIWEHT